MAVYLPHARTVEQPPYVTSALKEMMDKVRKLLESKLKPKYEFEPKQYMITINVELQHAEYSNLEERGRVVVQLRELVLSLLRASDSGDLTNEVEVTWTINAVDIVPKQASKLAGLQYVLEYYNLKRGSNITLDKVASIGNSAADAPVLAKVGIPFCSNSEADVLLKLIVA
jgi:hydroxymethylpyrimidine pyrophosphatase-like HAD family hydrolase